MSNVTVGAIAPEEPIVPEALPPEPPNPQMLAMLQKMSPEERGAFLKQMSQDYSGRGAAMDAQTSQAEALRDTAAPQMRGSASGYQVSSNPLEHLATGIKRYQGNKRLGELDIKRDKAADNKEAAMAEVLRRMGGM